MEIEVRQRSLCERMAVDCILVDERQKLGVSRDVMQGGWPLNGLRLAPENGTCGWYVWSGRELSEDPDFFAPMHARHLYQSRPEIIGYMGLPPGWRFLVAPGYEDIWLDSSLLFSS
ncbi:immunity protein Imm33 domain-containing protein [Nonomuraea sp. NPDC001684]